MWVGFPRTKVVHEEQLHDNAPRLDEGGPGATIERRAGITPQYYDEPSFTQSTRRPFLATRLGRAAVMTKGADMNETQRPGRTLRRFGAVSAGLLAIFALSTATDMALHASGVFPPYGQPMSDALYVLALAYRFAYGIVGCWIAARLAPDRPMHHALVLGLVGVVLSIAGAVIMWDAGPAWYSLAVIAIALPCAWVGGKLAGSKRTRGGLEQVS
jgi:hypothetical protein